MTISVYTSYESVEAAELRCAVTLYAHVNKCCDGVDRWTYRSVLDRVEQS